MQQHHLTITTYRFDELEPDSQAAALDRLRYINVDESFWHEYITDDAKRIGALLGIDVDRIYFSGFASQGDGACFEGSYRYAKGAAAAIRAEAPQDETLHAIADGLQKIQSRHFYQLAAGVRHSGHSYREHCTVIDVDRLDGCSVSVEDADDLADLLRDFMRWVYRQLEAECDYLTSDEAVRETIEANEYEFTADGRIY